MRVKRQGLTFRSTQRSKYRFRHYCDDKAHGSSDKKNWYAVTAHDAKDESFKMMKGLITEKLAPDLERMLGSKADFVLLECEPNDDKMLNELGSREWAHVKQEREVA